MKHIPVLGQEVLDLLSPMNPGVLIDGTWGRGGHARMILDCWPHCRMTVYDRDPFAIEHARDFARDHTEYSLSVVHGCFADMEASAASVDGILLDVGVSSCQIDEPCRGFSFQKDGPLDMGMGLNDVNAQDLVNGASEDELIHIFRTYGQERFARRIARSLVRRRQSQAFTRTLDLAQCVAESVPSYDHRIHPATRVFQALRIVVNQELIQLHQALHRSLSLLRVGGRGIVITFHSLEDALVKQFIGQHSRGAQKSYSRHDLDENSEVSNFSHQSVRNLTSKPLRARQAEILKNPRSSSAKMRAYEKVA